MPYCPQCRAEYRPGFETCAHCDVSLVAELEPDYLSDDAMAQMLEGKDLVAVGTGAIESAKELRRAMGRACVPCLLGPPQDSGARSCAPRVSVYVAREDIERAGRVFEERLADLIDSGDLVAGEAGSVENSEGDAALDSCPACGATLSSASIEECTDCGLALG